MFGWGIARAARCATIAWNNRRHVESYFPNETTALTDDGWFYTGDVARVDPDGFVEIVDRSKDIIKSGGEWISTVELENIAISRPDVVNAAAIAVRHRKWDERPVMVVQCVENASIKEDALLAHSKGKPPPVAGSGSYRFVDSLPLGATRKVQKTILRQVYGEIRQARPLKPMSFTRFV